MPQHSRLCLIPHFILLFISCLFFVLPSAKADEIITIESGAQVVADEFVVKYKSDATFSEKQEFKEVMNLEKPRVTRDSLKKMDIEQVKLKDDTEGTIAETVENLENNPAVQYVEPNYVMSIQSVNDPNYAEQWSLAKIGVEEVWSETMGSSGVVIAVLDTGIDYSHPDRPKSIVAGYDFINDDNNPQDDHGHGTFVSGVIAANTNNATGIAGICQNCSIMPVKVMDSSGMGTYADVANGIVWSADNGADIINLSIGGYAYSQILQDAVSYAQSKGVLVIAAGGNQGISSPLYPAAYSNVIGVSATTQDDERWSRSNYGSYIDISAPGVSIYGLTLGSYRSQTGTSAAAPHIAGIAGLLMSKNQALSPNLIAQQLYQNTVDLGIEGKDYSFGYGRIGFGVEEEVVEEGDGENNDNGVSDDEPQEEEDNSSEAVHEEDFVEGEHNNKDGIDPYAPLEAELLRHIQEKFIQMNSNASILSVDFDGEIMAFNYSEEIKVIYNDYYKFSDFFSDLNKEVNNIMTELGYGTELSFEYINLVNGNYLTEKEEALNTYINENVNKIVLNPGHGWYEKPEGVWKLERPTNWWGIYEDFINHDLAAELFPLLENSGYEVLSTREIDKNAGIHPESNYPLWQINASEYIKYIGAPESVWNPYNNPDTYYRDIEARPAYGNWVNSDIMISIHNNGNGSDMCNSHGTEIFYNNMNVYRDSNEELASKIYDKLLSRIRSEWDPNWCDRGIKGVNGSYGEIDYYNNPTVLIELAFMDVKSDNDALQNENFRSIAMQAVHDAILEYSGPPTQIPPFTDLKFIIDNDFSFTYEEKTFFDFFPYMHYKVDAKVKNVGNITSTGGEVCFLPKGDDFAKGCVDLGDIAPGATVPISLVDFAENFLYGNDPIGKLVIRNIPQDSDQTNNEYEVPFSEMKEKAGGIDLTNAELGGIKIDPNSNQIKFVIKGKEAGVGDEVIDLGDAKSEQTKIFLQANGTSCDNSFICRTILSRIFDMSYPLERYNSMRREYLL